MNEYGLDIPGYKDFFMLPWRVTIDNRVRWLQYRINHFILPTNKYLYRIGIIQSPNCLRCKSEIETLNHIFINCPGVISFWNDLRARWSAVFDTITNFEKMFGILNQHNDEEWMLKNQILLVARRYIYISRHKGSPLSIDVFDLLLRDTARIEETLARQKGNLGFHYMKWEKTGIYT